jgi:hypothetical protein
MGSFVPSDVCNPIYQVYTQSSGSGGLFEKEHETCAEMNEVRLTVLQFPVEITTFQ